MSNDNISCWQAVAQVKKGPSAYFRTRQAEERKGATLPTSDGGTTAIPKVTQGKPSDLEQQGLGSQVTSSATTDETKQKRCKNPSMVCCQKEGTTVLLPILILTLVTLGPFDHLTLVTLGPSDLG